MNVIIIMFAKIYNQENFTMFPSNKLQLLIKVLIDETGEFQYRLERYNIDYSIAIGFIKGIDIDLNHFQTHIRKTDRFVVLSNNMYAVILECADEPCGIKAANNLLTKFQQQYFEFPLFASVVNGSNYSNVKDMLLSLFHLLEYGVTYNMDNQVLDISQRIGG